jgi:hypothetical protein
MLQLNPPKKNPKQGGESKVTITWHSDERASLKRIFFWVENISRFANPEPGIWLEGERKREKKKNTSKHRARCCELVGAPTAARASGLQVGGHDQHTDARTREPASTALFGRALLWAAAARLPRKTVGGRRHRRQWAWTSAPRISLAAWGPRGGEADQVAGEGRGEWPGEGMRGSATR